MAGIFLVDTEREITYVMPKNMKVSETFGSQTKSRRESG